MASIEVDVDLDYFSDEDIRQEYTQRKLGQLIDAVDAEEVRRLAEMIAAGDQDEALELLHRISRASFSLAFIRRMAAVRQAA